MSRLATAAFAALVVATFGAFLVAQRLKNEPPIVQDFFRSTPVFSPNSDGRRDAVKFTFLLKQTDDVDVDILDADGDVVRSLVADRTLPPRRAIDLPWDGEDDAARPVPDGIYRARVTLRREGRSVLGPNGVRKDTRPPRPRVISIGPEDAPAAELLPTRSGGPVRIRFAAPVRPRSANRSPNAAGRRVTIWRTDGDAPERVTSSGATALADTATSWEWDGRADGRSVRAGTYLAVVESRDAAGNVGYSVPVRDGVPRLEFGRRLPGRGGITVRYLAVQPPSEPVIAGERADVFVDARGERWRWTLRRVGEARILGRSTNAATGARLRLRTPRETGLFLLDVRTATRRARVPIVVQANVPVGRVLVVMPWMTWQGRNEVDDDGDGRANTLDAGVGARTDRVFAGNGLPVDFAIREAPVLAFLERTRRGYDITTDIALARGNGPRLEEFSGALIPGDARWLPTPLGAQLRRFARDGGTVVSLGTESLRRQVEVTPGRRQRLVRPTNATQADLFGAVLRPVEPGPTELTVAEDDIELFAGDEGVFPDVTAVEATGRLDDGEVVADAVTTGGRPVIVAARSGRGLVVRTGIPDFPQRLSTFPESAALMDRLWVLMSRGGGG